MTYDKPHILRAVIHSRWGGDLSLLVDCPYTSEEPRPCRLGDEPDEPCLWDRFEQGEHHPDCGGWHACEATDDSTVLESWACWTEGEPEECDGFDSEYGHLHPIEGCYVQHWIHEAGFEDAVVWRKDSVVEDIDLPAEVGVGSDGDGVEMWPWPATEEAPA